MNMETDNSSTDTGIHQNNLANNTTFNAGPSYHCNNIGSDFGNSRVEGIPSYVRIALFFSFPEHVMKFMTNFFLSFF